MFSGAQFYNYYTENVYFGNNEDSINLNTLNNDSTLKWVQRF